METNHPNKSKENKTNITPGTKNTTTQRNDEKRKKTIHPHVLRKQQNKNSQINKTIRKDCYKQLQLKNQQND